jgi:hypothetical protein
MTNLYPMELHIYILCLIFPLSCSVGIHKGVELRAMKDRMESSGLRTLDLTDNDLAKDHLRHLVSY